MGFNYLQTDDRDDYFLSLSKRRNKKLLLGIKLISPDNKVIFECAPMFIVRRYCSTQYLPAGNKGKQIWRGILLNNGYKVENIYRQ